jgi:hypothetical protein
MSKYIGDIAEDATINFKFTTKNVSDVPTTLAGTPVVSVYKDNATATESTAGVTLTVDFDSITGLNNVAIDTSADAFYATGSDYMAVVTTGTVNSVSYVGTVIAEFSIENRGGIVQGVWDELLTGSTHNIANSAARRLRGLASMIILEGTAQGPAVNGNQIELDGDASAVDGSYDPAIISIIGGTGSGQTRNILEYDGTNKIATVDRSWKVNPDATSNYIITANAGREHVNEGLAQAGASSTITLNTLASSSDDAYNGQIVFIRSGLGEDQARVVSDYDGTTKVATVVKAWDINPDSTSAYVMIPVAANILESTNITQDFANKIADSILRRTNANIETSSEGDAVSMRSLYGAIAKLTNKIAISSTTLTVNKADDTTALGTQAITTDASADPITALDTV